MKKREVKRKAFFWAIETFACNLFHCDMAHYHGSVCSERVLTENCHNVSSLLTLAMKSQCNTLSTKKLTRTPPLLYKYLRKYLRSKNQTKLHFCLQNILNIWTWSNHGWYHVLQKHAQLLNLVFYNVFWREMVVSLSEQKCLFKIRSKIWKKESVFLFSLREGDWDRSSFLEIKSTNEDLWLKLLVADIDQTDFKIVLTTQK